MAGLAVAISWHGDVSAVEIVQRMLASMRHRGPNPHVIQPEPSVALGIVSETEAPAALCVADARLDYPEELTQSLATGPGLSDQQLLAHGYKRWGTALADRLRGDFALAVWDAEHCRLYAARDCFGIRPLFYHFGPRCLLLASEVEAILRAGVPGAGLDDRAVQEYLQEDHRCQRETLFAGVFRVRPGHWLLAGPGAVREERYWWPPRRDLRLPANEYPRRFYRLFRAAVGDRLREADTLIAQLSGGLDSSSVVCMADEVLRSEKSSVPAFHTVSAVFPGLECDETRWIDSVVRRVRFPHHRWNGSEESPLTPSEPCVGHPDAGTSLRGMDGDLRYARQTGASVILSGLGGDELLFERGVFRDLAASGRWLTLLTQTALVPRFYSIHTGPALFSDAIRATLPSWVRHAFRTWRPRPPELPPPWLGPALRRLTEPEPPPSPPFLPDETRRCLWTWLTSPNLWWTVELQTLRAARQGIQLRYPFLDRRLADFVLAVPYEHRLPRGRMKSLLRRAMADLLPPAVRDRTHVTTFDCLAGVTVARHRVELERLLERNEWLLAPYVDQKALRESLRLLDRGDPACFNPSIGPRRVLKCAQLEFWLRFLRDGGIFPFPGPATMNEPRPVPPEPSAPCPDQGKADRQDDAVDNSYEPPVLIPVGNLRNLLGKSGGRTDYGTPRRT